MSISVPEEVEMNPIGKIASDSVVSRDVGEGAVAMLSPTGVTMPVVMDAPLTAVQQSREEVIGDEADISHANVSSAAFKPKESD